MSSSRPPNSLWKGKAKATTTSPSDFDPDDLNPVITYRHLHFHNLGVKDPLRVIALCDSDAFYAACEQVRLGVDPSIPLVVLQWDSLIAVNYPARKYGIDRMCKVKEALRKCPHLKVVHVATYKEGAAEPGYWDDIDTLTHKVCLCLVDIPSLCVLVVVFNVSVGVTRLLPPRELEDLPHVQRRPSGRRNRSVVYTPYSTAYQAWQYLYNAIFVPEKASIDEAFIDLTRPVRDELLRRYPYLATVPPDAPDGKDSPLPPPPPISWNDLGTVIPVVPPPPQPEVVRVDALQEVAQDDADPSPSGETSDVAAEEPESELEGVSGEEDSATTWHDVALSIAAELMGKIRHDVYTKLGYSTSAVRLSASSQRGLHRAPQV